MFIILDLDRPRRGLIQVSQASFIDPQAALNADAGAGDDDAGAADQAAVGARRRQ